MRGEISVIVNVPWEYCCLRPRKELAPVHRDLLDRRPERYGREIGQAAHDQDDADQQSDELRAVRRERAGRGGEQLLLCQRTGDGEQWDNKDEAPHQHRAGEGEVVIPDIGAEPGKGGGVIGSGRGERVEDLAKAVRGGAPPILAIPASPAGKTVASAV